MPDPFEWQGSNVIDMVASLREHNIVFDRSPTGAGKTWMSLFAAQEIGGPVFIVTTVAVIDVWREVAQALDIDVVDCLNYEKLHQQCKMSLRDGDGKIKRKSQNLKALGDDAPHYGGWVFVGREWRWTLPKHTIIIFDEAHKMTGMTSKSAYFLKAAKDQAYTTICLSATLAESPLQMRALAYAGGLLRSFNSRKFKAWCLLNGCDYGDHQRIEYVGDVDDMMDIREQFGRRMTTADLPPDFPDSNLILLSIPVSKNPDEAYGEALKEMEEGAITEGSAAIRARQFSEWQKREWMAQRAKELEEGGMSVVLFVSFKETGRWLSQKLKCDFISGDTKDMRPEQIRRFQANESHFIVCIMAAGESFSLHDLHGRPRASMMSPGHSAKHFVQCLGRCPRAGSRQASVPQYILFAKGSHVEGRIRTNLRSKTRNLSVLTGQWLRSSHLSIMPDEISACEDNRTCYKDLLMPEDTKDYDKQAHSPVGPSNLKNIKKCPHYKNRSSNQSFAKSHEVTQDGLVGHLELELYFDPSKDPDKFDEDEKEIYAHYSEDRHQHLIDWCIDYAETSIKEYFPEGPTGGPGSFICEPRVKTSIEEVWGRLDLMVSGKDNGKRIALFDWKFGFNYQGNAADNLQGKAYVLGTFQKYPWVQTVSIDFPYPNLQEATAHTFKREDVPELEKEIEAIVAKWRKAQKGAQLHTICDVCEWCALQTQGCPKWDGTVETVLSADASIEASPAKPNTWDLELLGERPEEMAKALRILDFMKRYIDEAKQVARDMVVQDDFDIPGYRLVESNSGVTCTDPEGAYEVVVEGNDVSIADFMLTVKTLHAGKLLDILAGATHHGLNLSRAKAKEHWRQELTDMGIVKEGNAYSYLRKDN
jgi:superfamily II DNA or RNA helicase